MKRLLNEYVKRSEYFEASPYQIEKNFDVNIPKEAAQNIEMDEKEVAKDLSVLSDNGKDANKKLRSLLKIAKKAYSIRRRGMAKIKL